MSHATHPWLLFATLLAAASSVSACGAYKPGNQATELDSGAVETRALGPGLSEIKSFEGGLMVPDGRGGYLWKRANPRQAPPESVIEAQELRLRVRELAAQLLETRDNLALSGLVALPTSFVDLNNFTESSALGRYMAEAMFYEFNQRGVPVREYRLDGKIHPREMQGEFALTRSIKAVSMDQKWAALLVGTYLKEGSAFFVNVRLVRPADGMVLRTAQIVFGNNSLLAEMTSGPPQPPPLPFSSGSLRIVGPGGSAPVAAPGPNAGKSRARRGG